MSWDAFEYMEAQRRREENASEDRMRQAIMVWYVALQAHYDRRDEQLNEEPDHA